MDNFYLNQPNHKLNRWRHTDISAYSSGMATTAKSAEQAQGTEPAALTSIVAWAGECPPWQQDALRRLCEQDTLEGADLDELANICKGAAEASAITADQVRDPAASLSTVNLRSLHSAEHVNAIVANARLSFCKTGVTAIYGDNGSGKSGYARVLKKVCRARSTGKETIHANIYAQNPGVPAAVIDFTNNGANDSAAWKLGQASNALLSAVSVFDSQTASVHVTQTNDVAYTPLPMKMLAELSRACDEVKNRLNNEITSLKRQIPAVISAPTCQPETAVAKFIAGITAKTAPAALEALCGLDDEGRKQLEQLNEDLATDPVRAAARLNALKTKLEGYVTKLQNLATATGEANAAELRAKNKAYLTARAAAEAASTALFANEPLPNVGSEVWRQLWESARNYSEQEAYPDKAFPVTDAAVCVLCQQELGENAVDRMSRFESFVKDESKRREADAKQDYANALTGFDSHVPSHADIVAMVACIRAEIQDEALADELRRAVITARRRHRRIRQGHAADPAVSFPAADAPPLDSLRTHAEALGARALALTEEAGSDARKALVAERDGLAARQWLEGVKADVLAHIERCKEIAALEKAVKDTATNKITAKSTEVAKQLVTDNLRAQFAKEVAALGIADLAIELKQVSSGKGVPKFKVALTRKPDANVAEVLSEGEHRCVALAAFLAELATTNSRSAIVFDDPVSSLDHMHRKAVAARLAREGQHRQVIVFTHDIAFLFMLDEICRKGDPATQLTVRSVSKGQEHAGYCNDNPPMRAQPLHMVIQTMQNRLNAERVLHERGEQDRWEITVRSMQEQLRTTWERAVEEVISPVLKRLSNEVNTPGLAKLTVVTVADCETMRAAFGRCSVLLHSEPVGLNNPLPLPDGVEAEFTALRKWIEDVQQRHNAVR